MTDRKDLYTGISYAAWGYLFLYLDLNLGTVSILPRFVGYLLLLSAIRLLSAERRDLLLLHPLCILLAVWNGISWLLSWGGIDLDSCTPLLWLPITVSMLYFQFQLFTDFAALAKTYQPEGETLDCRFLRWRTVQVVLITAMELATYLPMSANDWGKGIMIALAVVAVIVSFCLMAALFTLRRCIRKSEQAAAL